MCQIYSQIQLNLIEVLVIKRTLNDTYFVRILCAVFPKISFLLLRLANFSKQPIPIQRQQFHVFKNFFSLKYKNERIVQLMI